MVRSFPLWDLDLIQDFLTLARYDVDTNVRNPDISGGYQVHFAIVQFSVNPGWRTQQNYVADCSATCSYIGSVPPGDGKSTAAENSGTTDPMRIVRREGESPTVFSVLPLLRRANS